MPARRSAPLGSLALALVLAATAGADEILLTPGSSIKAPGNRLRGTITAETPTEVTIGTQTVPAEQIDKVRYDGQPANMTLAETREATGTPNSLAEAVKLYQEAATEAASKPLI